MVTEVQRILGRILLLKLIINNAVFTFLSVHAPQVNRPEAEKERFYDQSQYTVAKIPPTRYSSQLVNGMVMSTLLPTCSAMPPVGTASVPATMKVREFWNSPLPMVSTSATPGSGIHNPAKQHYCRNFRRAISNVKVKPNKECVKQHHMAVCDFTTHYPCVKKHKFSSGIHTGKLKDPATAFQFQSAFKVKSITAVAAVATTAWWCRCWYC